eukprot:GHVH01008148.1.p1 GENE.GHVH01008148.1~~GHVH01008148.1.p1  ORF type:complete len:441 (+),score=38.15 GHVH01008148.1:51-1373(+)
MAHMAQYNISARHSAPAGPTGSSFRDKQVVDQNSEGSSDNPSIVSLEEVPMNSYFRILVRRSHTVTTLCFATVAILVFAYLNSNRFYYDGVKCGFLAVIFMFTTFAICCFPDDAFIRPCTAFWRGIMALTVLYLCLVVFCTFQDVESLRGWMQYMDSTLGQPLIEKSYAENCELFNADHPKGIFGPIIDSLDFFVVAHALGWAFKFLVLRDWTLCWCCSIGFELCEISFRYILPNFWECWWDHLLLDLFGCNLLGMIGGYYLIKLFDLMKYDNWRCVNSQEDMVTPKSGFSAALSDPETWTCWLFIVYGTLAYDVNYFFIKAILWLEPSHWMIFCRAIPLAVASAHSNRQAYDYMNNPQRKTVGVQLWIFVATILTEIAFIAKNFHTLSEYMPGKQLQKQPWYSVAILYSLLFTTIMGYIIAFINSWRKSKRKTDLKKND